MFKKKSIIGIVLVGIIALVVGLGSMSLADTSDENSRSTLPEDEEWMLVALGDKDNPQDVLDGTEITITFVKDKVTSSIGFSGSAGCNHYFGSFETTPEGLAVGPIGATEMWCGDEGVMDQESQFLKALGMVDEYQIDGDTLEMLYSGGALIFAAC
ncbi:META domain-containing protein [Chloroflexota bacterium]